MAPQDTTEQQHREMRARIVQVFAQAVPHNQALGAEVLDHGDGWALARLPYREDFLGDPQAGLWQTSVGISLLDAACGLTVFLRLPGYTSIATLDLRMEYLRPALAGSPLHAHAECHRVTRSIAFARGTLYQDDAERPTALCNAVFMRTDDAPGKAGQ